MPNENVEILRVNNIISGYGKKQILNDVTISITIGEIVALIGHNGAGKSTLLRVVFGLLPVWKGQIFLDGELLLYPCPTELLRKGVAYVPQGNIVFTDLSVRENLEMGCLMLPKDSSRKIETERILTLFPQLKPRLLGRAGNLSGGEKQMLALAMAMLISPRLLLLDEPSLGLAPSLLAEAFEHIRQINHNSQITFLIVEQKVREVLNLAKRVYVLRNGKVSFSGDADELDDTMLRDVYL